MLHYYNRKNEINSDRGCLFWGYRIIRSLKLRELLLQEIHKSHFGIVRMKEIARSYFWCKTCKICLEIFKAYSPGLVFLII